MNQEGFSFLFFSMWDSYPGVYRPDGGMLRRRLSALYGDCRSFFDCDPEPFSGLRLALADGPLAAKEPCYRAVMHKYMERCARRLGLHCPDPRTPRKPVCYAYVARA